MAKRILVIDDDTAVRSFIGVVLRREGYDVKLLESAINVENMVTEYGPELIVCDIMMPGRDGLAVCRAIKARPETQHIHVLLASAKSFESDKRAALNAGAAGYLVKPIREQDLANAVRNALASETAVKVWGCRGSIPTPENAQGWYGSNTPCLSLDVPGRGLIVLDAGTGLRALGQSLVKAPVRRISLLLTHFHWDHIFGLPFFAPVYMAGYEIHIYAPAESQDALAEKLEKQIGGDYFPVSIEAFRAAIKLHAVQQGMLEIEGLSVSTHYASHPGTTLIYRLDAGDHSLVYAPDNEILPEWVDPHLSGEAQRLAEFASGASLFIHDCAYSLAVYQTRRSWGHSCGPALAAVAKEAQARRVLLFHHDPDNTDDEVQAINQEFQTALNTLGAAIPSEPASEGMTYTF